MKRVILSLFLVTAMVLPAYAQYSGEQCSGSQCSVSGSQTPYALPAAARPRVARDTTVVQIISRRGNDAMQGTGVIVDVSNGKATIVSCAHILKEGYRPSVRYFNDQERLAEIVTTDAMADLSVLRANIVEGARIIKIDNDPQPGTKVYYYGYSEKGFTGGGGVVRGYEGSNVIFSGEVLSGVSGGPIYTKRGLVGIVTECRQYQGGPWQTYGPCATRIRRLLKKALPPYPNRPGIIVPKPPVRKKPLPRTSRPIPTVVLEPQEPLELVVFPPKPQQQDISALLARIDKLEAQIAALQSRPGIPGLRGPAGRDGKDGTDASLQPIPLDDLAAAVEDRLPPIYVQVIRDGKVVKLKAVPLGGTLPPVHVQVIRDGKVIENADVPLGGTLPLRLFSVR